MLFLGTLPEVLQRLVTMLRIDPARLVQQLLQVGLIVTCCYLALRVVRLIARRIEAAVDGGDETTLSEREQRGRTTSQLLRSAGRITILLFGALLSLNVFIEIGPLLAGAGILGLAVSFGAQSLVKDVITGFFYLAEGQFAVGDVIEVAGKTGVVERMTLRMVVLRDLSGVLHMVPNGQITTVSNMTRQWSRAVVDVGVAYRTDVDRALAIFQDEAGRFARDPAWRARFDGEPEIMGVQSLAESQVTIRTLLRTQPGQQWSVGREFRRRIKNRLEGEGIEIPFPQRTLHLRQGNLLPGAAADDEPPPAHGPR